MEIRNHIILFLDILGYSNLLANCKDNQSENDYLDKIYNIMSYLSEYIKKRNNIIDQRNNNLRLSRFKSLLFSDNILFFAPYEDEIDMGNLYMNLLYGLSEFLIQYTKEDIFFRGGITKGNLFYDEKLHFVFGSGLVKAYSLEKKAIYPRIVIDEELNPSPILIGINRDEDGEKNWYLDYLSLGYCLVCRNKPQQNYNFFLTCLEEQKNAISRAYQKYRGDEKIFPKYQWLKKYHNNFCEKNKLNDYYIM